MQVEGAAVHGHGTAVSGDHPEELGEQRDPAATTFDREAEGWSGVEDRWVDGDAHPPATEAAQDPEAVFGEPEPAQLHLVQRSVRLEVGDLARLDVGLVTGGSRRSPQLSSYRLQLGGRCRDDVQPHRAEGEARIGQPISDHVLAPGSGPEPPGRWPA